MSTKPTISTENAIRAAAVAKGYADAAIARQHLMRQPMDDGEWFVLSVRRTPGAE